MLDNKIYILIATFITATIGFFMPNILPYIAILALTLIIYLAIKSKKSSYTPQSATYKELEKIKKKRKKADDKKHKYISDQLNYIKRHWGYTQTQAKVIKKTVANKAYTTIYRKLTASILPQLIELVDNCNHKEQKGCKREVNKRINELVDILKDSIKEHKEQRQESYEISLEVLDKLMSELKK